MGRSGNLVVNLSGDAAYKSFKQTAAALGVSYNTVASAVKKLVSAGILAEQTNSARNRVFAYDEYLGILRKDT